MEMHLSIGELLGRVRASYLATFARLRDELAAERAERIVPEPAVCGENGAVAQQGPLGLPLRMDLCVVREGTIAEVVCVEAEELFDFEPVSFVWGDGLEVELRPFTWDACEVRFPLPADGDVAALVAWYRRWFDERDDRTPTNEFPGGVVHAMSDPRRDGDEWVVAVDLGSARLKAFEELIDAVAATRAPRLAIGRVRAA